MMPKPLIVSVPHQLGKTEARRRLRSGLAGVGTRFAHLLVVEKEVWAGDRLDFRVRSLGQAVNGTIEVAEDHVRLEVDLPWILGVMAEKLAPILRKEGTVLLEKK
jgi:hypothetical protein